MISLGFQVLSSYRLLALIAASFGFCLVESVLNLIRKYLVASMFVSSCTSLDPIVACMVPSWVGLIVTFLPW